MIVVVIGVIVGTIVVAITLIPTIPHSNIGPLMGHPTQPEAVWALPNPRVLLLVLQLALVCRAKLPLGDTLVCAPSTAFFPTTATIRVPCGRQFVKGELGVTPTAGVPMDPTSSVGEMQNHPNRWQPPHPSTRSHPPSTPTSTFPQWGCGAHCNMVAPHPPGVHKGVM